MSGWPSRWVCLNKMVMDQRGFVAAAHSWSDCTREWPPDKRHVSWPALIPRRGQAVVRRLRRGPSQNRSGRCSTSRSRLVVWAANGVNNKERTPGAGKTGAGPG